MRAFYKRLSKRGGGILVSLATVILAFFMGGIVVAATQSGGIGTRPVVREKTIAKALAENRGIAMMSGASHSHRGP